MKKMVKMAVLLATLLLLAGVAFGDSCYEVTCTNLDSGGQLTHNIYIDPYDGQFSFLCGTYGDLSMFSEGMKTQAITRDSDIDAYLKFHGRHGSRYDVVNGIANCYGSRWSIRGQVTDLEDCMCAPGCWPQWLDDGYCDSPCDYSECNYDNGDCGS